jgi:hypothetical protein
MGNRRRTQNDRQHRPTDHQVETGFTDAKATLAERAPLNTTLANIDQQLAGDHGVRVRIVSLEQPDHTVKLIGERPGPGATAREWDTVAGEIHQQLDAYQRVTVSTEPNYRATETGDTTTSTKSPSPTSEINRTSKRCPKSASISANERNWLTGFPGFQHSPRPFGYGYKGFGGE